MKLKKVMAMALAASMALSVVGCGGNDGSTEKEDTEAATNATVEEAKSDDTEAEDAGTEGAGGAPTYASIVLGESYTDLTTTIKWIHHKTDRQED